MAVALWVSGLLAGTLAAPQAEASVFIQGCSNAGYCTLDELYAGASFEVDGLDFNSWFDPVFDPLIYPQQGVAFGLGTLSGLYSLDLAQIIVKPVSHAGGYAGFNLSGTVADVSATPIEEDIFFSMAFSVSSLLPSYKISAVGLEWGPSNSSSFASADLYLPQILPPFDPFGPTATSSSAVGIPGVTLAESASTTQLPEMQPEVLALTDVFLAFGDPLDLNFGLAGIDDPLDPAPGQSIPEPGSLALALAGLWALARRQRSLPAGTASPHEMPLA